MDASYKGKLGLQRTAKNEGKRRRRPTTFAGFLTSERQLDNLITGESASLEDAAEDQDHRSQGATGPQDNSVAASSSDTVVTIATSRGATAAGQSVEGAQQPLPKRTRTKVEIKGEHGASSRQARSGSSSSHPIVKKVVGVQNATRKALEWLQHGDMTLQDLAQSLPKLSKARVEIVMEALRAAGLVTLVRKHAPDELGEDHVTEVYRFSAGRSAAQALDIGGGKPVALGTISKRIKTSEAQLAALKDRISVLKVEAAKDNPKPLQVLHMLRDFMKHDKSLDDDPFYSVALKATSEAAAKATEAAEDAEGERAAKLAARKRSADAAAAAAAVDAEAKKSAEMAAAAAMSVTAAIPAALNVTAASNTVTTPINASTISFSEAPSHPPPGTFVDASGEAARPPNNPSAGTAMTASTPFIGELGGVVIGVRAQAEEGN